MTPFLPIEGRRPQINKQEKYDSGKAYSENSKGPKERSSVALVEVDTEDHPEEGTLKIRLERKEAFYAQR